MSVFICFPVVRRQLALAAEDKICPPTLNAIGRGEKEIPEDVDEPEAKMGTAKADRGKKPEIIELLIKNLRYRFRTEAGIGMSSFEITQ